MYKKIIWALFMCVTSFFTYAQKTEIPPQTFGEYVAYKYFPLPINEMTDSEAQNLLGRKLIIQSRSTIIFDNSLNNVNYSMGQLEQIDYYRIYRHFDYRKLGIKDDTINVLSVLPEDVTETPIDIVITKENILALEYRSYIFLFRKK